MMSHAETREDVRARARAKLDALRAERETTLSEAAPTPATTPAVEPAGAAKPGRRSQDPPIADLLNEFHLTAEAVHDITPDVLDGRLRALAGALAGADRLRRAL